MSPRISRHLANRLPPLAIALALAACSSSRPAPVVDTAKPRPTQPAPIVSATQKATPEPVTAPKPLADEKSYVIQKGDTLISIALANGLDYRELAMWNNIENPNVIKLGDSLRLAPPGAAPSPTAVALAPMPKPGEPIATPLVITPMPVPSGGVNTDKFKTEPKATRTPYSDAAWAKANAEADAAPIKGTPLPPAATAAVPATPVVAAAPAPTPTPAAPLPADRIDWGWPVQPPPAAGKVVAYSDLSKGIDIPGTRKAPVLAAAPGKVIYAGSSLRGYGRLVIIRHTNQDWSSAYAHNDKILVEEGQQVKKGDKIAEMGDSDADHVKLHFEIRKNGKPVDPVKLLPN